MSARILPPRLGMLAVVGVATILLLMPFHAVLTVWLSQAVGHYTVLRLWKEYILLGLSAAAIYLIAVRPSLRQTVLHAKLFWLVALFITIQIVWGIAALAARQITLQALGYGWIVDNRFLLFFLDAWIISLGTPQLLRWWPRLVFIPAALVVSFGLLQYFILPYDFLRHLGYSAATIFPYEDINHNVHYIRVMSTLRGANPLGAYLVVVITLGLAWGIEPIKSRFKESRYKRLAALSFATIASLGVLWLSFSRGAWVSLLVSLAVLAWLERSKIHRHVVLAAGAAILACAVVLMVGLAVTHNAALQNFLLHTEDDSLVATTSNEGHVSALQRGAQDLLREPLGRGPGSAGPASAYNTNHPLRLAENFFIQIGQETGWVGLLLLIDILLNVGRGLYARRNHVLALGLLATLAGLCVANCFSHAWADDTLAYVYWGLAGVALAIPIKGVDSHESAV